MLNNVGPVGSDNAYRRASAHVIGAGRKWSNAGLGGWSNIPSIWKDGDSSSYSFPEHGGVDGSSGHEESGNSRIRSKSPTSVSGHKYELVGGGNGIRRGSNASSVGYSEFGSIWSNSKDQVPGVDVVVGGVASPPRLNSMQPGSSMRAGWDTLERDIVPADPLPSFFKPLGGVPKLNQRRMSHAPNLFGDSSYRRDLR